MMHSISDKENQDPNVQTEEAQLHFDKVINANKTFSNSVVGESTEEAKRRAANIEDDIFGDDSDDAQDHDFGKGASEVGECAKPSDGNEREVAETEEEEGEAQFDAQNQDDEEEEVPSQDDDEEAGE